MKTLIKSDTSLIVRIFLLFIVFLLLTSLTIGSWININTQQNPVLRKPEISSATVLGVDTQALSSELPLPDAEEIEEAEAIKIEQERIKAEEERLRKLRQTKIDKLQGYLASIGSPMAPYAFVVIDETEKCGADYRLITAIAGNESGYGRVPYKLYNPYGFLNDTQYSGWEQALGVLTCKVANYTNKYGSNLVTLGKVYGAHNYEQWAKNINWHLSRIP